MNPGQHAITTANSRTSPHSPVYLALTQESANPIPYRRSRILLGQIDWMLIVALLIALTVLVGSWDIILGALVP